MPKGVLNQYFVLNPLLPAEALYRDQFGLYKVIVAVTSSGKAFGIHSSNGAIVWSRILGLETGRLVKDFKVKVISSVLDGSDSPSVAVIANFVEGHVSNFNCCLG